METNWIVARPKFPLGCVIKDIRSNPRFPGNIYASLFGPDGELLISATLDYILAQINKAGIEEK